MRAALFCRDNQPGLADESVQEMRPLTGPDTATASRQGPAAIAAGHTDADGDTCQRTQDMFQAELC